MFGGGQRIAVDDSRMIAANQRREFSIKMRDDLTHPDAIIVNQRRDNAGFDSFELAVKCDKRNFQVAFVFVVRDIDRTMDTHSDSTE